MSLLHYAVIILNDVVLAEHYHGFSEYRAVLFSDPKFPQALAHIMLNELGLLCSESLQEDSLMLPLTLEANVAISNDISKSCTRFIRLYHENLRSPVFQGSSNIPIVEATESVTLAAKSELLFEPLAPQRLSFDGAVTWVDEVASWVLNHPTGLAVTSLSLLTLLLLFYVVYWAPKCLKLKKSGQGDDMWCP